MRSPIEVISSEPPKHSKKVQEIKDFGKTTPKEVQRFHEEQAFKFKLRMKQFFSYFVLIVLIIYFLLATAAIVGLIYNPTLANSFYQFILIIFSAAVGFVLGNFYEKSK